MKNQFKLLTLAASAAMMFAACSSDKLETYAGQPDLNPEAPSNAIQFGTYMGKTGTTRATGGYFGDITTTVLQDAGKANGFGVVAYMKGSNGATDCYTGSSWENSIPNFMWNQHVTYSADHWTYSPVKFWPNDFSTGDVDENQGPGGEGKNATGSVAAGKVSFFAYAPYVEFPANTADDKHGKDKVSEKATADNDGIIAMTANDNDGEPQVYYVLDNADASHAVDLLWALRGNSAGYDKADGSTDTPSQYNTDLTKQSVSEKVYMLFKHALSKFGGHTKAGEPAGAKLQTGVQVVLDVDNGSTATGVQTGTAVTGGNKQTQTLVTVKSVEIYDQKSASDASVSNLSATTSNLVKAGWFNIANGTWDTTTGGASFGSTYSTKVGTADGNTGEINTDIAEPSDLTKLVYDTSTPTWKYNTSTAFEGVTTTPKDLYTDASSVPSLMLIPSNTAQTLVVRICYIVRTYDPNLATAANNDGAAEGHWTKVTQTITNEVTIPANALKANTYYKLLIHLGLTSVKFSATVCDWEGAASGEDDGNPNTDSNNDKDIYLPSNTLDSSSAANETVSSASVTAGSSMTYSVPAAGGTFTINLTGIDDNATDLTVTVTGADSAVTPNKTIDTSAHTGTVTIDLTANSSSVETRTTTLTIVSEDASPAQSTSVTLVQVPTTLP